MRSRDLGRQVLSAYLQKQYSYCSIKSSYFVSRDTVGDGEENNKIRTATSVRFTPGQRPNFSTEAVVMSDLRSSGGGIERQNKEKLPSTDYQHKDNRILTHFENLLRVV